MTPPVVEFQAEPRRRYLVNGQPVPSVTQILGVLDKPALVWWAMRVGVEGACQLQESGSLPSDPEAAVKALTPAITWVVVRGSSACTVRAVAFGASGAEAT